MNKQIEEMAFDLCVIDTCKHLSREECADTTCAHCEAEALYNAGYRKQEDVAREIFTKLEEDIEAALKSNYRVYEKYLNAQDSPTLLRVGGKIDALRGIYCFIEELKKKYGVQDDGNC